MADTATKGTEAKSMIACFYEKHGDPARVVRVERIERPPSPRKGQLLVRVHAASLNPADWKSGSGSHAALLGFQWPRVYGFDFSGVVAEVGASVRRFKVGDRVFGMIRGLPQRDRGTVAELVLVEADICAACPPGISHGECASVPLVAITAVKAFRESGLVETKPSGSTDEKKRAKGYRPVRMLVTGGAGGVGTIAVQLAKALYGVDFAATTASSGKTDLCKRIGYDQVINYKSVDFEKELGATGDEKSLFDFIFDCTGEAGKCVSLLRRGGHLCSILSGPTAKALRTWIAEAKVDPKTVTFGVRPFLLSSAGGWLYELGSGARSLRRACAARGATFSHVIGTGNGQIMRKIADLMEVGELKAVIDRVFTLREAKEAIVYQKSGIKKGGKVIIKIAEEDKGGGASTDVEEKEVEATDAVDSQ